MNYYSSPFFNTGMAQEPVQPQQMVNPQFVPAKQEVQLPQYTPADLQVGGFKFTVRKEEDRKHMPGDLDTTDLVEEKKKRGRPRKDNTTTSVAIASDIGDNKDPKNIPTMYTYQETTNMLRGTLAQIDQLAAQVKNELDNVTASRTLKSKYNIMVGLSGNLGDIIGQKITAIKEINNAISKSNEMDYKREKDRKDAESNANDDKYLMDMYNAFIQNPGANPNLNPLGPGAIPATLGSTGIVRADDNVPIGYNLDTGYLNYVTNQTPEQKLMMVEDDPNIKQCVIYDAATGKRAFQWMNMSTGQPVPGLATRDPMFLEDTNIDLRTNTAKNININETYPVVVINDNVVNEY